METGITLGPDLGLGHKVSGFLKVSIDDELNQGLQTISVLGRREFPNRLQCIFGGSFGQGLGLAYGRPIFDLFYG